MDRANIPPCPNGIRHLRGTRKPGYCWTCENRARVAACQHDRGTVPHWAGILGMQYCCGKCGAEVRRVMP